MKVISLFVVLAVALRGECSHVAGDPCTPSVPSTCGRSQLMGETSAPPTGMFGPNVCNFTKTFQTGTRNHSLQLRCSRYWRYNRCRLYCLPNNDCSGPMMNFTKSRIDCCECFTTAASSSDSSFFYRYHHHRHSIFRNEGCPIALMETVMDCLENVSATVFQSLISIAPDLLQTLTSAHASLASLPQASRVTVFAPTNEVIQGLDGATLAELFGSGAAEVTLSAHVANSIVPNVKLVHGCVLSTLAENRFLHVTDVEDIRRRDYFRHEAVERTFVNGAEVVVKDACQAKNGIVHVVDSIVPTSNLTIAEKLGQDIEFSIFKDLLDTSDISVFLNRSNPRTVFAPTNAAFEQLPNGAVECLKMENNSRLLKSLVLVHISYLAEYTSSLCLRNRLATFLGPILRVQCINDTVHITRSEIPLAEGADRPARNGVVHAIDEVIVPDSINFESICPVTPTTTAPPTTTPTPDPTMIPSVGLDPDPRVPIGSGSGEVVTGFPVEELYFLDG